MRPWQNNYATPAQAREAIAGHQFDHPHILSVVDTHKVAGGLGNLNIKLSLPTDPTAAADMKQYAKNNAVEWEVPSGITSITVGQTSNGKYAEVGPGFELPMDQAIPAGEALTIKDGTATIVERPSVKDPIGTEIALFTSTEATTSNPSELTTTDGNQYLGTVVKTINGWEHMPEQPQLPDMVNTSTSPWQNPATTIVPGN